jgi:hypothetical protein
LVAFDRQMEFCFQFLGKLKDCENSSWARNLDFVRKSFVELKSEEIVKGFLQDLNEDDNIDLSG